MTLQARILPVWPIIIQGTGGVTVDYEAGRATIGFDYDASELGIQLADAVAAAEDAEQAAETAQAAAEAAAAAAEAAAANLTLASKSEAEAGTNNVKLITSLRAHQASHAASVDLRSFLPEGFNFASDDIAGYLETASAYSAANSVRINVSGTEGELQLKTCALLDDVGAQFHWDNVKFHAHDGSGMNQVFYTSNGTLQGRVAIAVTGSDQIHTGCLTIEGDGVLSSTLGGTTLSAVVIYEADNLKFLCDLYGINLSAVRYVIFSEDGDFGDVYGQDIIGCSTFDGASVSSGTVEVVNGVSNSTFGKAVGRNVHKPCRYISFGADANADFLPNINCVFGDNICIGEAGSVESSVLSVRHAVDCVFGRTIGKDVNLGLNLQRYDDAPDEATYGAVDGNQFGWVHVTNATTANSSALRVIGESGAKMRENWIEGVSCNGAEGYGL